MMERSNEKTIGQHPGAAALRDVFFCAILFSRINAGSGGERKKHILQTSAAPGLFKQQNLLRGTGKLRSKTMFHIPETTNKKTKARKEAK